MFQVVHSIKCFYTVHEMLTSVRKVSGIFLKYIFSSACTTLCAYLTFICNDTHLPEVTLSLCKIFSCLLIQPEVLQVFCNNAFCKLNKFAAFYFQAMASPPTKDSPRTSHHVVSFHFYYISH